VHVLASTTGAQPQSNTCSSSVMSVFIAYNVCITEHILQNKNLVCSQWGQRVSLCGSHSVAVMRYSCYANGFRFDSHLVNFTFFSGLRVTFTSYALLIHHRWRMNNFKFQDPQAATALIYLLVSESYSMSRVREPQNSKLPKCNMSQSRC